ncbi:MAG: hypothetical protein HXX16_17100 [Bacteroidales bacterium]|nr:hypothetical protein [Bacteroidales bacterium]
MKKIILSILILSSALGYSQESVQFEKFTFGLGSNVISDITQDKTGFLWLCSQDGLLKYDGTKFIKYTPVRNKANSLNHLIVNCIYEDMLGKIWVGALSGLCYYNPIKQDFTRISIDPNLQYIQIYSIVADKQGVMWIGTEYGLYKFNTLTKEVKSCEIKKEKIEMQLENAVRSLAIDGNKLWIGTATGLKCLDIKSGKIIKYIHNSIDKNSLCNNNVKVLYKDIDSSLWVGTNDGLDKVTIAGDGNLLFQHFRNEPYNKHSLSSNIISCLYQDKKKSLWVGTYNGLNRYERTNNQFTVYNSGMDSKISFTSDIFYKIYEDRTEILWIASQDGVYKYNPNKKRFPYYSDVPYIKDLKKFINVHSFFEDHKKNFWISGIEMGLICIDHKNKKTKIFNHDPKNTNSISSNFIRAAHEDKYGNIWICTHDKGLEKLSIIKNGDNTTYNFTHFPNELNNPNSPLSERINNIKIDDDGTIWIGGEKGFDKFDTKRNNFFHFRYDKNDTTTISSNNIYCIAEESSDKLWIGTWGGGLNLFNKKTGKFKRFINNPKILAKDILSIAKTSDNMLWIGTFGDGLYQYDAKNETFTNFSQSEGLSSNVVYGILEDERKNIWLSTMIGISHFNPRTKIFTNYDVEDGLQSQDFNGTAYYKSLNNEMFFGGKYGYNAFFADSIKTRQIAPTVVFTDFKIHNKSVLIGVALDGRILLKKAINFTDTIFLNYTDKTFSFEFATLDYSNPQVNTYSYKLEGVKSEWLDLGSTNSITFNNLQPDHYVLKIKTSNKNYIENEKYVSITIIITPPFWETWWFRSLITLLILYSIAIIFKIRINAIKKQKEKLKKLVQERTSELLEANNQLNRNQIELLQQKEKIQVHEQELETINEELSATNEELYFQREEILAQSELLKQQNEKLKEMDEFKQGMTSMIVHDLKNPLNLILNVPKTFDPIKKDNLIQQSGKQMLNMVMNILDVHKYEEVKMNLELKDKQLCLIAVKAVHQIQFLCEQKGIIVINEIGLELITKVEEEVLERVLINLLTNAIKYTPAGGIIMILANQLSNGMVKIFVTDTGEGIAEDKAHLVFQKFGQIIAKKSGTVKSTGLGLTFCKMAVEAHGGEIGFNSEVGKGTSFWFTLQSGNAEHVKLQRVVNNKTEEIKTINFTEEEREILEPIIIRLKTFTVYETDDIEEILTKLQGYKSKNIQEWILRIKKNLSTLNQNHFLELLNI